MDLLLKLSLIASKRNEQKAFVGFGGLFIFTSIADKRILSLCGVSFPYFPLSYFYSISEGKILAPRF